MHKLALPSLDLPAWLARHEISARPQVEAPAGLWNEVWRALPFQLMACTRAVLDYQAFYLRDAGIALQDLSLVLLNDGQPCGLFPLMLSQAPGAAPRLSAAGGRLLPPLFLASCAPKTVKRICTQLLAGLQALQQEFATEPLRFEQPCMPGLPGPGLGEWHQQLMALGALPTLRHELFTDLRPPLEQIRSGFRKSYKPLINAGLRHWRTALMDHTNASPAQWQEFVDLHIEVAGRRTRSDATWDLQYRMLREGWAFLAQLRDPADGRLVGAGFFQHNRDEAVYCVGAYDRNLFDKPLGHVVQQIAVTRLKELGVPWYRLGDRPFVQDVPAPSDKQLAIAGFKQGFASELMARYEFELPTL